MKLKTLKPLYLGGQTLVAGMPFETIEQHGRQLIQKGYAELDDSEGEVVVTISQEDAVGSGVLTTGSLGAVTLPIAPPVEAFKAKHKGAGKWAVVDAEGTQVGELFESQEEADTEAERLIAAIKPETTKE
ncbi:hypothetical protein V0R50_10520 [Pseudomonas sp. 148P]|uniref:Uncharacterized protein n=1 Tax=Pseudomonas ulcerans TaxID=3115852 RepID=A0ABU7HQ47_9PSED|nr:MULTISPECIES: hypothetical protein [unclassified Pseudomonas]MEE1922677.1 hypothetical protein [Pseudomonas sp. 147P]MEE1933654.1 hypothetical protein [Pseudomonas sp. 148P]